MTELLSAAFMNLLEEFHTVERAGSDEQYSNNIAKYIEYKARYWANKIEFHAVIKDKK